MNRINKLFAEKQKNILNIYCTAGFPHAESLSEVLAALQESGADMVEIGMPYSDPIADGPIIQNSDMIALHNGMTIQKLFDQSKNCRQTFHLPLILMGYLNPVMQFGIQKFCELAKACGVDGIILPDLPLYEYEHEYRSYFEDNGLHFIFLVTPETTEDRIRKIDGLSNGFIYAVSSSSTTGGASDISKQSQYFQKLKEMELKNPVLAGFGIRDRASFMEACRYTNGGIIGSAYIKALEGKLEINAATKEFMDKIKIEINDSEN